jgi:hypothetical protein
MQRPRFRLRTLMIAVGLIAFVVAALVAVWRSTETRRLAQLSAYYQDRAKLWSKVEAAILAREEAMSGIVTHCDATAETFERAAERWRLMGDSLKAERDAEAARKAKDNAAEYRALASKERHEADFYTQLKRKYVEAANRPWIPISPDPPFPK